MTNKLTDAEVIKALEEHIAHNSKLMLLSNKGITYGDLLDLLTRQKAEIERLQKENEGYAELEQGCFVTGYKNIRAEAIKEFAERLKANITINNTEDGYLLYSVDYNCLMDDIDGLVKEMVGDMDA